MLSRIGRELAYFSFFLLLTIVLLWPHILRLDTAVSDRGDPLHMSWIIDWVCYSLTHSPLHVFDAPMFYPNKYPLAYSENLIGVALFVLPFHLLRLPPLVVYNIAAIIGYALAGYGASVLARQFTTVVPAVLVAGIVYGLNLYKVDHLPHMHIMFSGWVPLLLAALIAFRRSPTRKRAVLLCAAYVMNGLTAIHWLLYGSVTIGLTILFWIVHGSDARSRLFWLRLIGALAIGGVILIPILIPYRIVSAEYKMKRNPAETEFFSATWQDWLVPGGRSAIYTPISDRSRVKGERALFPGLMPLFLTGAAIALMRKPHRPLAAQESSPKPGERVPPTWLLRALDIAIVMCGVLSVLGAMTKRIVIESGGVRILAWSSADVPFTMGLVLLIVRWSLRFPVAFGGDEGKSLRTFFAQSRFSLDEWTAGLWIIFGVLGSLGLHAFFHTVLFRLQIVRSVRVPARWAIIVYAGLAVWSALGVTALLQRKVRWRRHAAAALVLLSSVGDVWPAIRWEDVVADPPPVYRWMRANRDRLGPFLELPMAGAEFEYLLGSTTHHVPIVNGLSSFEPGKYGELRRKYEATEIDDAFLPRIEQTGCQYILVHVDLLLKRTDAVLKWIQTELGRGTLKFVRRFDNGIGGDYLFAVTRNGPRWRELRGPQIPDGAGYLPDENLARMLAGKETFSTSTVYWIDAPPVHEEVSFLLHRYADPVHGPLRVSGWALAPSGIRSVNVCVDDGKRCFPAEPYERADVLLRRPWYPNSARPGFTVTIPRRPKGTRRQTDFYLEITDGQGRTKRTSDYQLYWD